MTQQLVNSFDQKLAYEIDPQLTPLLLQELIKQVKENPNTPFTDSRMSDDSIHTDIRKSKQSWFYTDHWIGGVIYNLFVNANESFFHYDLNYFGDGIQVTIYKEGDFFDWHTDGFPRYANDERKLSISLLLTDDYEGGELEFDFKRSALQKNGQKNPSRFSFKPKAGTAIIFPAWLPHRVKPVTSGERICLVAWQYGPVFK